MFQAITTFEMQKFEAYAVEHFEITVEEMMQNAGKAVFDVVMKEIKPGCVLVVAGKGNNGGDALVTARLLYEAGAVVTILSPYPNEDFSKAAGGELEKIMNLGVPIVRDINELDARKRDAQVAPSDQGFDLIIDALFGFSLKGNPKPPADEVINWMNYSGIPILSVDVPSGLDAETGQIMDPIVKATYTVALGMIKIGLDNNRECVGRLFLGNLGIPEKAYQELGIYTPIFLGKSYIPLD